MFVQEICAAASACPKQQKGIFQCDKQEQSGSFSRLQDSECIIVWKMFLGVVHFIKDSSSLSKDVTIGHFLTEELCPFITATNRKL